MAAVIALWSEGRSGHATVADRPENVERLIERDPEALLVAEEDGEVMGALIVAWDGWRGNLYRLTVRAERRRLGVGRALVRAGEESLRRRGAARVTALVAFEDERAAGFWNSVGYPADQEIGRRVRNI